MIGIIGIARGELIRRQIVNIAASGQSDVLRTLSDFASKDNMDNKLKENQRTSTKILEQLEQLFKLREVANTSNWIVEVGALSTIIIKFYI